CARGFRWLLECYFDYW
nr:immunoglobulin heavy chain junction region [Mus musculus]